MTQVESDEEAPPGFVALRFAGIGMMARMIEPKQLNEPADWINLVSKLEAWGRSPQSRLDNFATEYAERKRP